MSVKRKVTFALDIGTRSIIGLLMEEGEKGIILKEIVYKEHSNRAMLDGQIHNIPEVSSLVKEIKKELEKKSGLKLKKVAIAAAGRSLIIVKANSYIELDNQQPIKKEDILNLELKCAQEAQAVLIKEKGNRGNDDYYCVGYSVIKYYLDNNEIGNLMSQKGKSAGLEVVAAFLPKVILESLQEVLKENKLELANITLEPIAAINAILPSSMRKLNLALVDIGAGTSDIAISYQGSIIGYGMVPVAGDEITEALCEKYILDFSEGEELKRKLYINLENSLAFSDILGFEHLENGMEILNNISEEIKLLAEKIANEILSLNSNPPQAVILIGGGSLTPLLPDYLAEKLNLSKQRVAVQKASSVKDVVNLPIDFHGPEIVTPLGIALTAMRNPNLGYIPVKVNDKEINLLNLGQNTVLNALLAAGVPAGQVYGKPGQGITVEVNGKITTFPGSLGQKAKITINNKEAGLDTLLKPRDKVEYIPAQDGKPGKGWVKDLLGTSKKIVINKEKKEIPIEISIDGVIMPFDAELNDGNKIYIRECDQVGEILEYWKIVNLKNSFKFVLILNGTKMDIMHYPFEIIRNDKTLTLFDKLQPGDEISLIKFENNHCTVEEIIKRYTKLEKNNYIQVTVNKELIQIPINDLEIIINGEPGKLTDIITNQDVLEINDKYNKEPILIDVFPKINFSTTPPVGCSNLEILLNNQEAEYTSLIKDGDSIKLAWK